MTDLKIAEFGALVAEEVVQLPSQAGTEFGVKLRKPKVISLLYEGEVINVLQPLVSQWAKQTPAAAQGADNDAQLVLDLLKAVPELEPRLNKVVVATMLEPAVSMEQVVVMAARDRAFILLWALGEEFGDVRGWFRGLASQNQRVQSLASVPTGD